MKARLRAFVWFVVLAIVFSSIGTLPATAHPEGRCGDQISGFLGFSDISKHGWYCEPVVELTRRGAIGGYSDGTFRPNNVVTRGQFSKMIVVAFGYPVQPPWPANFVDVPAGSTFYEYVQTAVKYGLMSGTYGSQGFWNQCIPPSGGYETSSQSYFRPCLNITRAQMSKPLAQAAGLSDYVVGRQSFSDVPPGYVFHEYIERLAMHNRLEEIPLDTLGRPTCSTAGSQPCYQTGWDVRRSDAAQLIYLALSGPAYNSYGQAFPRRLREVNGQGGHDGVQAFVTTPSSNPPCCGYFIAGPLGVADAVNLHWIESGPERRCYNDGYGGTLCVNHPYASSAAATFDAYGNLVVTGFADQNFYPAFGASYEYRSYYAGFINGAHEWWSEYYNTGLQRWVRLVTIRNLGVSAMREVFGSAETQHASYNSGPMRITNARAHTPGGAWSGWCWDPGVYRVKMFNSYFGSCPPGAEPYTWDVEYRR